MSSQKRFPIFLTTLLLGILFFFNPLGELPVAANPLLNPTLGKIPLSVDGQSFVTAAVNRTGSSVVRIDTETVVTRQGDPLFDDPFLRDLLGDFSERSPAKQRIAGQGSGFIIDASGVILTNAHVVNNADKVTVTLKDGRAFNGIVRGTDEVTDLAVVKIDPRGESLPVAPLGDSAQIQVGDWAIAVGNPVGLDNTVTLGIVSTIGRSAASAGIPDKRLDFIQTDAAINPGNSGGPLLNSQGEVIGINTAIRADAMGIGFAIPINKAKALESTLAAGERVAHPYIGVQMVGITPEIAQENNDNPNSPFTIPEVNGVLVVKVLPNTPAQKAGMRAGDVILQANEEKIIDGSQLQALVESVGINESIDITLQRGDQVLDLKVKTAQLESNS
jgi:S1-C subfamily serine protease